MAVGGGLLEDGRLQLEVLDDAAGPEVEVLADNVGELPARLLGGPVVHHGDGEGLGDPDGIRHLGANHMHDIWPGLGTEKKESTL